MVVTCDDCGKKLPSKSKLIMHQRTHTGEKPFKCEHCECYFSRKSNIKRHINAVHYCIKDFSYTECDARFSEKADLKRHIDPVHIGIKNFRFAKCRSTFTQQGYLTQHIKSVHEKIRYSCSVCSKTFSRPSHTKRHMKTAHQNDVVIANHVTEQHAADIAYVKIKDTEGTSRPVYAFDVIIKEEEISDSNLK